MPTIVIHDAVSGETVEREMTAEELAQYEADQAAAALASAEAEADRLARAEARAALLERLGITEDEARLLLG